MAVNIVTGMTGRAHITSDDDRMSNASVFGTDKHVFAFGQQFRAEVMNNNLVRIRDGYCINQGTMMAVELNDYEDVIIDNGISGLNRNDLIAMRYEKNADTSLESAKLVVIKGVQSENAADPPYQTGNILDGGDLVDDYPFYRVKIESLTITAVEPLFEVWKDNMSNIYENVNGALHGMRNDVNKSLDANKANVASQLETQNRNVSKLIDGQKQGLQEQDEKVNNRLNKFADILEPYEKGAVSGVKGSAETEYRTGNVNIAKADIGLENVPNVTTNDQTPTYTTAGSDSELQSGEKLSVSFGKIARAIKTLIGHVANKSNPHSVTKSALGLGNVQNKSSATIRGEITKSNIINAYGWSKKSVTGTGEIDTTSVFFETSEIVIQVCENTTGNYYTYNWTVIPDSIGMGDGITLLDGYQWNSVNGFCAVKIGRAKAYLINCIVGGTEYKNNATLSIFYR